MSLICQSFQYYQYLNIHIFQINTPMYEMLRSVLRIFLKLVCFCLLHFWNVFFIFFLFLFCFDFRHQREQFWSKVVLY